jgi:hypothetical protein
LYLSYFAVSPVPLSAALCPTLGKALVFFKCLQDLCPKGIENKFSGTVMKIRSAQHNKLLLLFFQTVWLVIQEGQINRAQSPAPLAEVANPGRGWRALPEVLSDLGARFWLQPAFRVLRLAPRSWQIPK